MPDARHRRGGGDERLGDGAAGIDPPAAPGDEVRHLRPDGRRLPVPPGLLFDLSFLLAAPVWLLMIFVPAWGPTRRIAASPLTAVPVLLVWTALVVPVAPDFWAAVSNPAVDRFRELAALPGGAGAIWAQIIAWDLLIGQWIYLEGRRLAVHPLAMGPLLVLTVFLSPLGLLLFLVLRALRTRTAASAPAPVPAAAPGPDGPVRAG
ncbi:ABA4-like family protein [Streptomyces sp. TRM 70361]|uniref:ABA4-like family protein n=1 Tax=Streptomyces sp. TRM 70361 TaxID=3116553 RepID=UPI002E7B2A62|nr:ABA4-like family protein [Streptomyces sp. TRM 70361]MEE1937977.1 ABA4-like family protein [Streptomyces sp. TRM 70361]